MTRNTLPLRPALAAVVAVLALSATPAKAQLEQSSSAPPDVAAPILPDIPVEAASAPPALPQLASEADVAVSSSTRTSAPLERTSRRVEEASTDSASAAVAPVSVVPRSPATPAPAVPIIVPQEMQGGPQQSAMPAQPATPTALPAATASDSDVYWILGGGGALLALGFGAFTALRRRTVRSTDNLPLAPERLSKDEMSSPNVVEAAPAVPPIQEGTTAPSDISRLEAMVAEPPSADNPFVTRRKRLRRAEFILRTGHAPESASSVPAQSEPSPAAVRQQARKPSYSFSRPGYGIGGWKPATT